MKSKWSYTTSMGNTEIKKLKEIIIYQFIFKSYTINI